MAPDANAGNQWERVAAELRACREAQQRAWGDLDDALLGRYLAGEVDPEERRQIESALHELPELRKLTDLVRDVLGEFGTSADPLASAPQAVPYGPATLPFSLSLAQPATVAVGAGKPSSPSRPWPVRPSANRYRQRAGLVAAAMLLLALGVALPQMGMVAAPAGQSPAMSQLVALRGMEPSQLVLAGMPADHDDKGDLRANDFKESVQRDEQVDLLGARIQAEIEILEKKDRKREAKTLARQYASNLTRIAQFDRQRGELARAEQAYNEARQVCARTLGPDAPETVRTRNSLADVYEVALNTVEPSGYPPANANFVNPYFTYSASPKSAKGFAAKNGHHAARVDPAAGAYRGYSGVMKTTAPPAVASPRGLASPVRTSSGYEPPAQAVPQQRVESYLGQRVHAVPTPSAPALQQQAVALRERIISQRQTELKQSVVPVLTQALREAKDPAERQRFAAALGRLGPAASDSVGGLLDCYHQATVPAERATILLSLGEIGPSARQALPVLIDSLQSDAPEVRHCAAQAIVQFGPAAKPSLRKLVLDRPDDRLLQDVLVRIDGPEGRSGIDDESGCFSLKAIQETRQEIHQLAATFRLEVRVETSPDPVRVVARKSNSRQQTLGMWNFEKSQMPSPAELRAEAKKRTRELGEYGVYVHINKDAPDVQVFVSDALQAKGLTDKQLRQVLEPHLRKKEFDRGLREGVHFLALFEKEHSTLK